MAKASGTLTPQSTEEMIDKSQDTQDTQVEEAPANTAEINIPMQKPNTPPAETDTVGLQVGHTFSNLIMNIMRSQAKLFSVTLQECDELYHNRQKSKQLDGIPSNDIKLLSGFNIEEYNGKYYLINNSTFSMDVVKDVAASLAQEERVSAYGDEGRYLSDIEIQYIQYLSMGTVKAEKGFDNDGVLIRYELVRG